MAENSGFDPMVLESLLHYYPKTLEKTPLVGGAGANVVEEDPRMDLTEAGAIGTSVRQFPEHVNALDLGSLTENGMNDMGFMSDKSSEDSFWKVVHSWDIYPSDDFAKSEVSPNNEKRKMRELCDACIHPHEAESGEMKLATRMTDEHGLDIENGKTVPQQQHHQGEGPVLNRRTEVLMRLNKWGAEESHPLLEASSSVKMNPSSRLYNEHSRDRRRRMETLKNFLDTEKKELAKLKGAETGFELMGLIRMTVRLTKANCDFWGREEDLDRILAEFEKLRTQMSDEHGSVISNGRTIPQQHHQEKGPVVNRRTEGSRKRKIKSSEVDADLLMEADVCEWFLDGVAKGVPGRTGTECRRSVETLKKSYNAVNEYCDEEFAELKGAESEFGKMKLTIWMMEQTIWMMERWFNEMREVWDKEFVYRNCAEFEKMKLATQMSDEHGSAISNCRTIPQHHKEEGPVVNRRTEGSMMRKDWSDAETDLLLAAVASEKTKPRSPLNNERFWEGVAKRVPGRTGKTCRMRMDTLKKSYNAVKNYCDEKDKEFAELKNADYANMKLATSITESWFKQIRDHCPPKPTKRSRAQGPRSCSTLGEGGPMVPGLDISGVQVTDWATSFDFLL